MAYTPIDPVETKEHTKTSFANQVRDNQVDHEARILAIDERPPPVTPNPLLDIQTWAFASAGNPTNGYVNAGGTVKIGEGYWDQYARYMIFTSGFATSQDNKSGSAKHVVSLYLGQWTGGRATKAYDWGGHYGGVVDWTMSDYFRLISFATTSTTYGTYCKLIRSSRKFEIWVNFPWIRGSVFVTAKTVQSQPFAYL